MHLSLHAALRSRFALLLLVAGLTAGCGRIGYDVQTDAALDSGRDASEMDAQPFDLGAPDLAMPSDAAVDAFDAFVDMGSSAVPGVTVAPTTGLVTSEFGGTATFTVVLDAPPIDDTASVFISLSSSDTSEGTLSPTTLAFTSMNWNAPQTVTVTGVDDAMADGAIAYTIVTAPCVSSDSRYSGIDPADVAVSNTDDETAGVTVSRSSGLSTSESGASDTFTIRLNTSPTDDVTIGLSSSASAEATASPASLTFTTANYASPQLVTVTGVDDSALDGNQPFTILTAPASSTDPSYNGFDAVDVTGTNLDNETAGIVISPTSGISTTEAGATASFTVVLQAPPTANVAIPLASSDTGEGTVSGTPLMFTTGNWNMPVLVTVTGIDDAIEDGAQPYRVTVGPASSTDSNYDMLPGGDVLLTNLDDDSAGLVVSPLSGLVTTEAGGTATFTVALATQPATAVTLSLASNNTLEGTVSDSSLAFDSSDWSMPRTVTLNGVDDAIADGDAPYVVTVHVMSTTDTDYAPLADVLVSATNTDNEIAGVTVSPLLGLTTTEGGGTAMFSVVLNSEPTNTVSISLASDTITEGTVSPAGLTFTAGNWSVPQTVVVTGVDDLIADGARVYHIVTGSVVSSAPEYNGLAVADVTVTNTDDDTLGVAVTPTAGLMTTEAGGAATFTVALTSEPTATVSIALSSSNTSEGTVSPASLSFSTVNWATPQTVTVTGVNDSVDDGNVAYTIVTGAASSTDLAYNGFAVSDVSVTNLDNDAAGVVVMPTSGLVTTEAGATASFTIVLTSQPTSSVSIPVNSSSVLEGTLSTASVVFTTSNWSTPQTVTITGVNDFVDDGDFTYSVVTGTASSLDFSYNAMPVADVSVTNLDDDSTGITVTPTSGLTTTEVGGTATFTVVLTSQPSATVTIALSSSNTLEGTVSPASLNFNTGNWSTPQTVTITGVNDFVDDGDIAYTIVTAAAVTTDVTYTGVNASDVSVTNTDNDSTGITVTPTSGLVTTEAGTTATFTVVLTSQPTANVSIALSSTTVTEGTVSPAGLTFTTANWNMAQTVTLTGVNDAVLDPDVAYTIVTGAAVSTDTTYSGLAVADVTATNQISPIYVKASNSEANDGFGKQLALSADRTTLVVAAQGEDSSSRVINSGASDNAATDSGALYVFVRSGGVWSQQAYIKTANADASDGFGMAVAISSDGNTIAASAMLEASNAAGINGNAANNSLSGAGAAYVFTRSGTTWTQQAYIKASNPGNTDYFGSALALSSDGNTLAVGARFEASNALGVNGNQADNSAPQAGAAYVFVRSGTVWSQQAYLKRSVATGIWMGWNVAISGDGNTLAVYGNLLGDGWVEIFLRSGTVWSFSQRINGPPEGNGFGVGLALSTDASVLVGGINQGAFVYTRSGSTYVQEGSRLYSSNNDSNDYFGYAPAVTSDGSAFIVGAEQEDSNAVRINGDGSNNSAMDSGAAYTFTRSGMTWSQQFYIKAPNTDAGDYFAGFIGTPIAISPNMDIVAIGAYREDSNATGIGGDQTNNAATDSGAVYIY